MRVVEEYKGYTIMRDITAPAGSQYTYRPSSDDPRFAVPQLVRDALNRRIREVNDFADSLDDDGRLVCPHCYDNMVIIAYPDKRDGIYSLCNGCGYTDKSWAAESVGERKDRLNRAMLDLGREYLDSIWMDMSPDEEKLHRSKLDEEYDRLRAELVKLDKSPE